MGHDPPPPWGLGTTGLPGAPPAYQGYHRPSMGTTELPRDTTYLSGPPQACQEHHRPSRGTTGLPGALQACQGTTCLAGAPQACQRHYGVVRGTTVPSRGTSDQEPVRGTTDLSRVPQA